MRGKYARNKPKTTVQRQTKNPVSPQLNIISVSDDDYVAYQLADLLYRAL